VLIVIEVLFVLILSAILFTLVKNEGSGPGKRFRQAKAVDEWGGENRRKHPRISQTLSVSYSVVKARPPKNFSGKTVDISEGGLKLVLDEKLPSGTCIELQILLPDSAQSSGVMGNVVWTEDALDIKDPSGKRFFYSGVKFSFQKEHSAKFLINYIRSISLVQEG
jgi:c-di-GMP-binding flagellar brake protein YcgR